MNWDLYPERIHVLASRGARLVATIIDILACLGLGAAVFAAGSLFEVIVVPDAENSSFKALAMFMMWVVAIPGLAFVIAQAYFMARHAQSIGKRVMKIYVARASTGERCGFARYFWLRGVGGKVLDSLIPFFALIDPLMIFAADRRCLHDWVADTVVVRV